jgi:hypothetical protein
VKFPKGIVSAEDLIEESAKTDDAMICDELDILQIGEFIEPREGGSVYHDF